MKRMLSHRPSTFSTPMVRLAAVALALWAAAVPAGCAGGGPNSPYQVASDQTRDPLKAQTLTLRAVELMDRKPDEAEKLLREALAADIFHGPAHNNLGVLCLKRSDLAGAASEFEFARKLLPGVPDPRLNLALTLERAGRLDEALATYSAALEVLPDHVPSMQGLARLQLSRGKTDHRTGPMLEQIALRGETEQWRDWARLQRARTALP